ncbi:MAG: TRAP transporter substrate-binding protein [Gammaproteobacteria bacterium]|jgi:TRAP-type mannitol/chloroaromatic compound transport system substrate-binding protein|nr:TRAP transporter substrate-binding protein [Gammaproteobacteria bacterium]MBT4462187.1 TRAP transporter substrate-binding protein [Gammaproteobacteria bacterium]MBT4654433.1 TRAP transporter substrate-binding protein [Gammaproteobacteria bacterium]MBT5116436.1 TRAP transporter substrate-binding protein [Gammaproteobacteria bacterium]MBT5761931.1 TRAP transporter substrate-binding protein [Gammaproteobacteria bacterium]
MKRRKFLKSLGGTVALTSLLATSHSSYAKKKTEYNWKMVTSWPKNFPGLGVGAENLAKLITNLSNNRITVKVFGANELVPPLEVFDFVSKGGAELGHSGAYYWKGKSQACQFFSSVPFGMNSQEMNAWLYYGDGIKLWEKLYNKFNLIPRPAGNTGVQMGGWFNRKVNKIDDLKGLKMRIPGLGGEVLSRAGGTPVTLAGSEIFTALQTGVIDATEWVGPYNDRAFGLHKAAKYYYYPGWHEPGPTIECMINKDKYNSLPTDLKLIIDVACKAVNLDMLSDYTSKNNLALQFLKSENINILRFPDEVLSTLKKISEEILKEISLTDSITKEVYNSYMKFKDNVTPWTDISDKSYLDIR